MQIEPILTSVDAAIQTQLAISGGDPTVEQAGGVLMTAIEPALRQAAWALAEQAATEISAQLGDRSVRVVMSDGEPVLEVVESSVPEPEAEDFDARITLRLPPSLKGLVEDAAGDAGDSVNSWIVRTLASRAKTSSRSGRRVSGTFEL